MFYSHSGILLSKEEMTSRGISEAFSKSREGKLKAIPCDPISETFWKQGQVTGQCLFRRGDGSDDMFLREEVHILIVFNSVDVKVGIYIWDGEIVGGVRCFHVHRFDSPHYIWSPCTYRSNPCTPQGVIRTTPSKLQSSHRVVRLSLFSTLEPHYSPILFRYLLS